jgi:hypothetical protein
MMAEYIDREKLLKRFNIDDMMNVNGTLISLRDAREVISSFPAADVAPVVRCKDCQKSGVTEFGKRFCSEPMGAFYGCIPVEDDFFCSGGRRRDGA